MSWKSVWIYLKSQIKFWNLKILFKSEWNSCISNFYFKHKIVPWVCIQTYHVIDSNTHTWHHSDGFMFEIDISRQYRFWDGIRKFQIWTKISNLKTRDLRFQINSNRFSRHRSFGHQCLFCWTDLSTIWSEHKTLNFGLHQPVKDRI